MQRRTHHNRRQLMAHPAHKPFRIPRGEYYIKSEIVLLAYTRTRSHTVFITRILYIIIIFIVHGDPLYAVNQFFSFFPGVHYAIAHTIIIHRVSVVTIAITRYNIYNIIHLYARLHIILKLSLVVKTREHQHTRSSTPPRNGLYLFR